MKAINRVRMVWYYAILCGLSQILDGLSIILTLGHWSTDLSLRAAFLGARKSWIKITPKEEQRYQEAPIKPPIDYIDKVNRYEMDGDGDAFDDFGSGLGGQPLKEKRFCKGCHADVTERMYCSCGDFDLLKEETLSEEELKNFQ